MNAYFGRERSVITKHVRNVFREGERDPKSVCAKFAHTAADGKTYQVDVGRRAGFRLFGRHDTGRAVAGVLV
jgi:hypothetical protein